MNIQQFEPYRRQVASFMTRLYDRQLTTASGGNISLRINKDLFCITPSALDKGLLSPDDIAVVHMDGENLTPKLKLSIETEMHRLILVAREDCKAIVHAHPTYVSAFSAMQKNNTCAINTKLIAESFYILEEPVLVPYRLMGTEGLAQQAAFASYEHDVLVLENHGVVALGRSMLEAFDKMELLERAAQMTVIVKTMEDESCKVSELDESRLKQLMHMKYGK